MSILNAIPKQFSISDEGTILYQAAVNDPRPGVLVATLSKGESALAPQVDVVTTGALGDADPQAVKTHLEHWVKAHIETGLQVLAHLAALPEETPEAVKALAVRVYERLGILPRAQLRSEIAALDADTRRAVRALGIRLGPLFVFQPELNKPAAVRLRGILWSVFNDKPLPFTMPKDGAVSFTVDPEAIDRQLYQTIGYPVYGTRAVRIDMLDRVVTCVYDHAQDGQFQARHEMAEWLGCPIADLYAILEDMGHKKVSDPADDEAGEGEEGATPKPPAANLDCNIVVLMIDRALHEDKPVRWPVQKPDLAIFALKRGRADGKAGQQGGAHKKPFKNKSFDKSSDKPRKPKGKKFDKKRGEKDHRPKVVSAKAKKVEDSPFAILQQLKGE